MSRMLFIFSQQTALTRDIGERSTVNELPRVSDAVHPPRSQQASPFFTPFISRPTRRRPAPFPRGTTMSAKINQLVLFVTQS